MQLPSDTFAKVKSMMAEAHELDADIADHISSAAKKHAKLSNVLNSMVGSNPSVIFL